MSANHKRRIEALESQFGAQRPSEDDDGMLPHAVMLSVAKVEAILAGHKFSAFPRGDEARREAAVEAMIEEGRRARGQAAKTEENDDETRETANPILQ
jgi:hypothetical protein